MDIKTLVTTVMIAEATRDVHRRVSEGAQVEAAIQATAKAFHLETNEIDALKERALKASKNSPVEEVSEESIDEAPEPTVVGNAMHFDNEDDLDSATGMLMYKGVPWKSKGQSTDNKDYLVEFDDEATLQEALGVLRRKFDFVEHNTRRVGVVEFDNLADYGKVMEFMKKNGMMIECCDLGQLDEDIDLQEKMINELEGQVKPARSYAAIQKGGSAADLNVVEDRTARAVVVRKRYK